jgi:hypothetical protein
MKPYIFTIKERPDIKERFLIPPEKQQNYETIIAEAVRIFYYAKQGFEEAWPLTFILNDENDSFVAHAHVFIMSGIPDFEVILF